MQRVLWALPASQSCRIFANPNGGKRDPRTAARLKAEGVKAGVPDITVAIPRPPFPGMYIELKRQHGGKTSVEQRDMLRELDAAGYHCVICRGADSAWAALIDYLG